MQAKLHSVGPLEHCLRSTASPKSQWHSSCTYSARVQKCVQACLAWASALGSPEACSQAVSLLAPLLHEADHSLGHAFNPSSVLLNLWQGSGQGI